MKTGFSCVIHMKFKFEFHDVISLILTWNPKFKPQMGLNLLNSGKFSPQILIFRPKSSKLRIFLSMQCREMQFIFHNLSLIFTIFTENSPKMGYFLIFRPKILIFLKIEIFFSNKYLFSRCICVQFHFSLKSSFWG